MLGDPIKSGLYVVLKILLEWHWDLCTWSVVITVKTCRICWAVWWNRLMLPHILSFTSLAKHVSTKYNLTMIFLASRGQMKPFPHHFFYGNVNPVCPITPLRLLVVLVAGQNLSGAVSLGVPEHGSCFAVHAV